MSDSTKQYIFMETMILIAGIVLVIGLFAGCGGQPVVADVDGRVPIAVVDGEEIFDDDQYPGRGGGSLPIGYYARQCQWDACGGPLPDRQQRASNPIREDSK
jgi:hypothetical protein